jgi:hypothetical protein
MHSARWRVPRLSVALPMFAVVALCCSISIASAANGAQAGSLTGTWSGKYSGAYHGTFILHWTQRGTRLSGTIKLSTAGGRPSVNGTVRGSTIHFGTVGSAAITYSGTVSGKSMSGHYQTPGGGGTWSAHKTS